MAKITNATAFHRHLSIARCSSFNRRIHKPYIQTAGQPQPSQQTAQLACILGAILMTSSCALLGIFPETTSTSSSAAGSTINGASASAPAAIPLTLANLPIARQFDAIEREQWSQAYKAEMLNLLGMSYLGREDCHSAIACFRQAIEKDPNLVAASNNLGAAMLNSGDCLGARKAFESTVHMQPQNAYANRQLDRLAAAR